MRSKILTQKEKERINNNNATYISKKNQYILNTNLDILGNNKIFINSFFRILWEYPEIFYNIIKNSNSIKVLNSLSYFLVNNYYINYLSSNYLENNFIYVISLLLKDEINNLSKIENFEIFLESPGSKVGLIFEKLYRIPDIHIFFRNIILESVENLEKSNIVEDVNIDAEELTSKLTEYKEQNFDIKIDYNSLYNQMLNDKKNAKSVKKLKKFNETYQKFIQKYTIDIDKSYIENKLEEAKKSKNDILCVYYDKILEEMKNNENIFSNKMIMENILKSKSSIDSLTLYQNNFFKIVFFIEKLIKNFEKNMLIIPNTIKYICTIISLLIKTKFKNITKFEENIFISKFLINKLLIKYLSSPNFNALISDFIITDTSIKIIELVIKVLIKFFSGKLYKNNKDEYSFTPYNWIFLENFEKIGILYESITNINLPIFIQNLINDKLSSTYLYEYFDENENKIYNNSVICFKLENLTDIIDGIQNTKNIFENGNSKLVKLKKSFDKVKFYLEEIKKDDEERKENYLTEMKGKNTIIDKKSLENFYVININKYNKKYEKLFKFNKSIKYFYIEIKDNKIKIEDNEKNIIKLKNYLIGSLYNYRLLSLSDFNLKESSSLKEILIELKNHISNFNYTLNKNTTLSSWYITSILDSLKKIPEEYKKNNYEKLFDELITDIKNSIEDIQFEKIILLKKESLLLDKRLKYYEEMNKGIKDIIINESIKIITEKVLIPIELKFMYNETEKYFEIKKTAKKQLNLEDKIIFDKSSNSFIIKTIYSFTKFFPNLSTYHFTLGINPLQILKELDIINKLEIYFDIIEEQIVSCLKIEKNKYNKIYKDKIYDFVISQIYDKIYPPIQSEQDTKLFLSMEKFPQSELDKYDVNSDYNFDIILPLISQEYNKIHIEKTPNKKLNCIKNIIRYISNVIGFNDGYNKKVGTDDIVPVLFYLTVKSKPYMIMSDIEFIYTFFCNIFFCDNELAIFESIINKILNYKDELDKDK